MTLTREPSTPGGHCARCDYLLVSHWVICPRCGTPVIASELRERNPDA